MGTFHSRLSLSVQIMNSWIKNIRPAFKLGKSINSIMQIKLVFLGGLMFYHQQKPPKKLLLTWKSATRWSSHQYMVPKNRCSADGCFTMWLLCICGPNIWKQSLKEFLIVKFQVFSLQLNWKLHSRTSNFKDFDQSHSISYWK